MPPITEYIFVFEDLKLPGFGEGAYFYGEATLIDNSGETDLFVVDQIKLQGGNTIWRGSDTELERQLFKAICDVLYDDKPVVRFGKCILTPGVSAAFEWAEHVSELEAA